MSDFDPVHPAHDPPVESPGDDGDGMYGWDSVERAAWKARIMQMVAANQAWREPE